MMCFLAQCFGSLFCVCHEVKVRNLFCWVHYMLLFFFLQLECQSHLPKQHAFKLTMENVHKCIRPKIVFGNPFFCEIWGFYGREYTSLQGHGTSCSLVGWWQYILEHCHHLQALGVSGRLVKSVAATCLQDCKHHIPKDNLDPVELHVWYISQTHKVMQRSSQQISSLTVSIPCRMKWNCNMSTAFTFHIVKRCRFCKLNAFHYVTVAQYATLLGFDNGVWLTDTVFFFWIFIV